MPSTATASSAPVSPGSPPFRDAERLLAHLHDKLVLDWRRRAATTADVRLSIKEILDADLPADPYPPELFDAKVQAVFDQSPPPTATTAEACTTVRRLRLRHTEAAWPCWVPALVTAASITDEVVEQLRHDAEFVALVAQKLGLTGKPEQRTITS